MKKNQKIILEDQKYHSFYNHQKPNFLYGCSWQAINSLINILIEKNKEIRLYEKKGIQPIIVKLENSAINIDLHIITEFKNHQKVITDLQKSISLLFKNILEIKPNYINIILYTEDD